MNECYTNTVLNVSTMDCEVFIQTTQSSAVESELKVVWAATVYLD